MTSHAVQIILKILFARLGGIPRQNGGKTAVFLTLVLIMLEFWFLDTLTSHAMQKISKILFARHWRYIPPKWR